MKEEVRMNCDLDYICSIYAYNVKKGTGFIVESEIFRTGITGDLGFKFI